MAMAPRPTQASQAQMFEPQQAQRPAPQRPQQGPPQMPGTLMQQIGLAMTAGDPHAQGFRQAMAAQMAQKQAQFKADSENYRFERRMAFEREFAERQMQMQLQNARTADQKNFEFAQMLNQQNPGMGDKYWNDINQRGATRFMTDGRGGTWAVGKDGQMTKIMDPPPPEEKYKSPLDDMDVQQYREYIGQYDKQDDYFANLEPFLNWMADGNNPATLDNQTTIKMLSGGWLGRQGAAFLRDKKDISGLQALATFLTEEVLADVRLLAPVTEQDVEFLKALKAQKTMDPQFLLNEFRRMYENARSQLSQYSDLGETIEQNSLGGKWRKQRLDSMAARLDRGLALIERAEEKFRPTPETLADIPESRVDALTQKIREEVARGGTPPNNAPGGGMEYVPIPGLVPGD